MAPFRRLLPRRRWLRILLLVVVGLVVLTAAYQASLHRRVGDPPVRTAAQVAADQRAAEARAAAAAATSTTPPSTPPAAVDDGGSDVPPAATVPDVPLAWKREAAQAAAWPRATSAPALGRAQALPTVPAARVRDTIGLNVDLWRTEYGYRDFSKVIAKAAELSLRHARVTMLAGPTFGLSRMQALGEIGVRLDVEMGDAFGRYSMAPYPTLEQRLKASVLPYVDSVEGTNEPDLAKVADWAGPARSLQKKIVAGVAAQRGKPIAVIAPAVGKITSIPELGDYAGLADATNAHAYSNGAEPSTALDDWLAALAPESHGAPTVVTEAGFQDDVGQRNYQLPLPSGIAADYVPRTILEAMRRGIPRVYLYEMINRWSDPFHVDAGAHFGLLDQNLRPKPAWTSLLRLQRALLDGGRPDAAAAPLHATVVAGPSDLRLLAFRRKDGRAALAVWRSVSEWNTQAGTASPVAPAQVEIDIDGSLAGALTTNLTTGSHERLTGGRTLRLRLSGSPVVVDGIR
ncbi:MAG: hypothetical protein AAGC46_19070 [Solirubrobacteraceae bacterium]|nr:hypothetical protein [Patulibacter sp.]